MNTQIIRMPGFCPTSQNLARSLHWRKYAKLKKQDLETIAAYCAAKDKAKGRRRLLSFVVTHTNKGRRPDPDNLLKILLDGLVKCGMLVDDATEWLAHGGMSVVYGEQLLTTVTLTDIEPFVSPE